MDLSTPPRLERWTSRSWRLTSSPEDTRAQMLDACWQLILWLQAQGWQLGKAKGANEGGRLTHPSGDALLIVFESTALTAGGSRPDLAAEALAELVDQDLRMEVQP